MSSNEAFKQQVVAYCDVDDRIKEMNAQLKELKIKQKEMSESILMFMTNNSLEVCNAGNYGVLSVRTSVSKSGINKDSIKESLDSILKDKALMSENHEILVEQASERIMNNRESTEKHTLKRSAVKKSK